MNHLEGILAMMVTWVVSVGIVIGIQHRKRNQLLAAKVSQQ